MVVVLDVGGATTDVYCVPDPDAEQATLGREAVGVPARRRTVEGDLGVSWSVDALRRRPRPPRACPCRATTRSTLGEAAATVALRRHLRAEAAYGAGGASARAAGLVVLSGGVFRHADPAAVDAVVAPAGRRRRGRRQRRRGTAVVVDRRYVLAPSGCWPRSTPRRPPALARRSGPGASAPEGARPSPRRRPR